MPIYRRKGWPKDKHHIVVKFKTHRRDRIVYGSKADAKVVEASLRVDLQTLVARESSVSKSKREEPTFFELCLAHYAPHVSQHVRESTWSTRKFHVKNLVEFFHDAKGAKLSDFTTAMLDEYAAWRKRPRVVAKKRGGEIVQIREPGAEARTINNEFKTLSTIRTFAKDEFGIVTDLKIKHLPEQGTGRVKFWTDVEIKRLYEVALDDPRGHRLVPVLVFLANTGCRKGEAIHAERRWVDLDKGMLTISPNPHWQPKNGEAREVTISDSLLPYLKQHGPGALSSPFLFTWARKKHPERRHHYKFFPNKTFARLVKKAGLTGGPHKLRHSYASSFLANGGAMWDLSLVLGHSHEKVTALYSHLVPGHLEQTRNKVNVGPSVGPAALEAAARWRKRG